MKTFEIALASAIGVLVGLVTGMYFEWNLLATVPIGGLVGFVCFRPIQILLTCRDIAVSTYVGLTNLPEWARSVTETVYENAGVVSFYALCVIVACLALFGPSALLCWFDVLVLPPGETVAKHFAGIACSGIGPAFLGIVFFVVIAAQSPHRREKWVMPICTSVHRCLDRFHTSDFYKSLPDVPSLSQTILVCAVAPIVLQLLGLFFLPLVFVDVAISVVIGCACSARIAVTFGGALGCLVGAIYSYEGAESVEVILAVGMIAGACTGAGLYKIRTLLTLPPPVPSAT
jgi:hypothetical protein